MSKPGRGRAVAGALGALAAGLLIAAGPAAADPIESSGPAPSLPRYQGAPATAQKIKDPTIAPQNPFMATNPNSNIHNDTWMTDAYQRTGPLGQARRSPPRARSRRRSAARSRSTPSGRHRQRLPLAVRPAAGPDHGPGHAWRRSARYALPDRPEPARDQGVPELHRRRLLLPRQQGPHLGPDQDRPHLRLQRGRRRRHA